MKSKTEIITSQRVSTKDISVYLDCSSGKAYLIKKMCEDKFNGSIPALPNKVTTKSFLKSLNSSVERELESLNEGKK